MKALLPIMLGVLSVLQAGINERLLAKLGLSATVMLNSLFLLCVCSVIWFLVEQYPSPATETLRLPQNTGGWEWWYLFPGLFGYCLVAGLPLSFSWIGAARTMTILVSVQIIAGLAWDYNVRNSAIEMKQLAGAVLAIIAAYLTTTDG